MGSRLIVMPSEFKLLACMSSDGTRWKITKKKKKMRKTKKKKLLIKIGEKMSKCSRARNKLKKVHSQNEQIGNRSVLFHRTFLRGTTAISEGLIAMAIGDVSYFEPRYSLSYNYDHEVLLHNL